MNREALRLDQRSTAASIFSAALCLVEEMMSIRNMSATVNKLCSVLCSSVSAGEEKEGIQSDGYNIAKRQLNRACLIMTRLC